MTKRVQMVQICVMDIYEDVSWIPATSVECERIFSTVGPNDENQCSQQLLK